MKRLSLIALFLLAAWLAVAQSSPTRFRLSAFAYDRVTPWATRTIALLSKPWLRDCATNSCSRWKSNDHRTQTQNFLLENFLAYSLSWLHIAQQRA